jgi:hypothetical protein
MYTVKQYCNLQRFEKSYSFYFATSRTINYLISNSTKPVAESPPVRKINKSYFAAWLWRSYPRVVFMFVYRPWRCERESPSELVCIHTSIRSYNRWPICWRNSAGQQYHAQVQQFSSPLLFLQIFNICIHWENYEGRTAELHVVTVTASSPSTQNFAFIPILILLSSANAFIKLLFPNLHYISWKKIMF